MKKLLAFLFVLIVALITVFLLQPGAGTATESLTVSLEEAIQPRNAGAFWYYKSVYFENGQAQPNGTSFEEVVETKEIDGVTCYHVRLKMDWRSLWDRLLGVKLEEEGYWHFWEYYNEMGSYNFDPEDKGKPEPETLSDFDLTLPFPVQKGRSYEIEGTQYEVLAVDKEVEVPAGQFSCVVYQMTYPVEEGDDYISRDRLFMAKGVGLVVVEGDFYEDGEWVLDYRDELSLYDLKLEEPPNPE